MLSLSQVRLALQAEAWLVSLDLDRAHWHIQVHPHFWKYFAVEVDGQVLQLMVIPFGLNIAPRVFTKLTRVVAVCLASLGVNILMY